jgi:TPR repeat protein
MALVARLVVVLLLVRPLSAAADFEAGVQSYQRGDYVAALQAFLPLARGGNVRAQAIVALMYFYGEGVPRDDALATQWYRRAAESGFAVAQFNLGKLNAEGRVPDGGIAEAQAWYRRAAAQGHRGAESELAQLERGKLAPSKRIEDAPGLRRLARLAAESAVAEPGRVARESADSGRERSRTHGMVYELQLGAGPSHHAREGIRAAGALPVDAQDSIANPRLVLAPTRTLSARSAETRFGVQLGASRSPDRAAALLSQVRQRNEDLLEDLAGQVERRDLGPEKGVWYRIRVGTLPTRPAATRLCEELARRDPASTCFAVDMVLR